MRSRLGTKSRYSSALLLLALFEIQTPEPAFADSESFPAWIEAVERSDVYSRAEGIVEAVLVDQGDFVEAGAPLLRLRNDLKKLAVDIANAELVKADTLLDQARDRMERVAQLSDRGTTSNVALFEAQTDLALAQAEKALAGAELKIAQTNYRETVIRAPISGYVEDPRVGLGSLIEFSSGDPPLFEIVNLDRLRIVFDIPYTVWADKRLSENRTSVAHSDFGPFRAMTETGDAVLASFSLTGSAAWVDGEAGSIRVWADLDNADHTLLPGMHVVVASADDIAPRSSPVGHSKK